MRIGPIAVDDLSEWSVMQALEAMAACVSGPALVCTPNIAHVRQVERNEAVAHAYARADLVTPDGWPVAFATALFSGGGFQPERVTGADMARKLLLSGLPVAVVGGKGNSAHLAAAVAGDAGGVVVAEEPVPRDELDDPARRAQLITRIAEANPDIILLGVGVPRQEQLALELMRKLDRGVVLCVGVSIEFIAGTTNRASPVMQRLGLEWLHRLAVEPRKLLVRYLTAAPYFSYVFLREICKRQVRR